MMLKLKSDFRFLKEFEFEEYICLFGFQSHPGKNEF